MAINLHKKYLEKFEETFSGNSYLKGKTCDDYSFTGIKGVRITSLRSVPLVDYTRRGTSRYGEAVDMQDSVQEMLLTQDRAFSLIIDKGDSSERQMKEGAGMALKIQQKEQIIPMYDSYGFYKMAYEAGTLVKGAAPTKTTVTELLADAIVAMEDAHVPAQGCYMAVTSEVYKHLKLSPEYQNLESIGEKALIKGVVGEFMGVKVVRVPSQYLKAHGICFMAWHPSAVISPDKLHDTKIHKDPPGVSGHLLEGRFVFDTFVLGAKSDAVYVYVDNTAQRADEPVISVAKAGNVCSVSVTATGGDTVYITTDGTDPRYSTSRVIYSGADIPVDITSGYVPDEIRTNGGKFVAKAVAYRGGAFPSKVAVSMTAI